jgi:agmatinase
MPAMPTTPDPRTILPDARVSPRFSGIATFCRFPRLADVDAGRRPVDWALYGVPFDGGVTYRPGARFAPRAIREASQYVKPVHLSHGVSIVEKLSLADAGDAPVEAYSCKGTADEVSAWATALPDPEHMRLLAVGGDHSIAYGNMSATWQRRGKPAGGLAVLHFDAHLDTVDAVWGERWGHASPFIRAAEDGLIDAGRMLTVGIRGPLNAASDLDAARDLGIEIVTYDAWRDGGADEAIEAFRRRLGGDEVYLSFDIDCVDPAFAPGTGTPVCGGFSSADVFGLLLRFVGINLVGADVVEVLPAADPTGVTSLLAGHVLIEILALAAVRSSTNSGS